MNKVSNTHLLNPAINTVVIKNIQNITVEFGSVGLVFFF